MSAADTDDDGAVGYGRPPRHAQFKPGVSGNPAGRPRHAKGTATLIRSALYERIAVRENGKVRRLSKLEASLKQLANKAAGGDLRAITAVITLGQGIDPGDTARAILPIDEADRRVLDLLIDRARGRSGLTPIGQLEPDPVADGGAAGDRAGGLDDE
ncbi:MAG: DUF5681 domain-containing protein [Janthinobacterium lividum]